MAWWNIITETFSLIISGSDSIPASDSIARGLVSDLNALNSFVPLDSFKCNYVATSGGVMEFSYKINSQDGRKWKQSLFLSPNDSLNEVAMTFNVNDRWRLNEFSPGRNVRDAVINLILMFSVLSIEAEWILD